MTPTHMPRDVIVGLGAAVCDEADLQGSVSFGSQAIAHPRCAVWAIAAPVVIGDRTILEDHARLENADQEQLQSGSATVMTIGSDNIFEAGCIVRSASVGNGNLFEPKSETLPGSKIGSNCVIGSGVVIGRDEVVPDNAVIVCIRDPSAPCGTRIVRQQKPHLSAARASLTTKYITTFLDAKSPLLGVGAYRDDNSKPVVLPSVLEAERRIMASGKNKEYAGIAGMKDFVDLSLEFAYGEDSQAIKDKRIAAVQTISGTGGVRVAGEFFSRFLSKDTSIYLPNPTWGNHIPIMKDAGMNVLRYTYYEPASRGLDFAGFISDLKGAPDGSVFLLHACAHNPTGVDPTMEQWAEISDVFKAKKHIPFFDCAYQGFASGDASRDAAAVRHFVKEGHKVVLCQSYAKNFGLYGERVGALSVVCEDEEEAKRVESQLKIIIRPMYSNPPIHGALIVSTILSDPVLKKQWYGECKSMADRIISMRTALRSAIERIEAANGVKKSDWRHITDQIGMFCYTGLTEAQVSRMIEHHHIYLTKDGRVSMAGVTSKNVEYIAQSIAEVVQNA